MQSVILSFLYAYYTIDNKKPLINGSLHYHVNNHCDHCYNDHCDHHAGDNYGCCDHYDHCDRNGSDICASDQ